MLHAGYRTSAARIASRKISSAFSGRVTARRLRCLTLAAAAIAACGSRASAQTYTWTGDGVFDPLYWSDPGNWLGDAGPVSGTDTTIVFPSSATDSLAIQDIASPFELNSLVFDANYLLEGDPLEFVNSSASVAPTIMQDSSVGTPTVVVNNLVLGNDTTFGGTGSDPLALAGTISGPGGLTINPGELYLYGSNSYTGTTTIAAQFSALVLFNSDALQDSTLSIGGTLVYQPIPFTDPPEGRYVFFSGIVEFDSSVSSNTFDVGGLSGEGDLVLENDAATPAAITLNVGGNNADTTFSGSVSGPGNLIKVGSGTLILSGDNSYTGGTTFNGGALATETALPSEPGASLSAVIHPFMPLARIRR